MPLPHIKPAIPVIAFCNILEPFLDLLNRAGEGEILEDLSRRELYRGDRTLLWVGDPKLVIVSYPIPHADYLLSRFNYPQTRYIYPKNPGKRLSEDVQREPWLAEEMLAYAGEAKTLQIIPYQTTPEFLAMVAWLRQAYDLKIILPESPEPQAHWLRDYIDTKIGFHEIASRNLAEANRLLPLGIAARSVERAADIAEWFFWQGKTCMVKGDDGENGISNYLFRDMDASRESVLETLREASFLQGVSMIVEEIIPAENETSPSLEVIVPARGQGEPQITYLSQQLFKAPGDFYGVLVSRELRHAHWYPTLEENGLRIAKALQNLGYVGLFDLDCIISDDDELYLVEINSRRTGGTHVHDFAVHFWGDDYLDQVVLLSNESMFSGNIASASQLIEVLDEFLYPVNNEEKGLIITVTAPLAIQQFGCIIVAQTTDEALSIQEQVTERIRQG